MNLPKFSVQRPILVTMMVLIVLLLGSVAFRELKVDLLPSIELPTVTVDTRFPGANPEVMERLVTQIVEEIIATNPGIEELTSRSGEGWSRVTVLYEWGTDVDAAALELQAKLEDEINELPEDVRRPRVGKFDIDSFPVVLLGISSALDPVELTEIVENQLRYRLTRIPGVAQADLWGSFNREVRVELDPDRIRSVGLSLNEILDALRRANLDVPTGQIEAGRYEVTLRAPAEFQTLDEIRQTVIRNVDGADVRLAQVAEVLDTYSRLTRTIRVNGDLGLRLAIRKKAGANTVEVSQRILEEIELINNSFPQLQIIPVINQGNFIQRSIENVARSVLYGGGLAILVLLFFLRNFRSTLIIAVSIPTSIIATFAMVYFMGFTINLMTLGGFALGVGMMVDSSIVVIENIFRRREELGEKRDVAAAEGAAEVASAIVASTVTTLVIFLPVVFVRGVSGVLFTDLALVIVFALCASLLVSLSLVPMLASRFLRSRERERHRSERLQRLVERSSNFQRWLEQEYGRWLAVVLRHPYKTISATFSLLILSILIVPFIGTEFIPPSDEGEVAVYGEMEVGTRLDLLDEQTRLMEELVFSAVPEMVSSVVTVRGNESTIQLALGPAIGRNRSNVEIADDLRERLTGKVPGMEVRVRAPQGQFLLQSLFASGDGLSVEIRGYDTTTLSQLAHEVEMALRGVDGIADVRSSLSEGIPQEMILIDREKIADAGLYPEDVARLLETAIAGRDTGEYRLGGNSYRIFVQLKDAQKRRLDEVLDLMLRSSSGDLIPLRNMVSVESGMGPEVIERKNQERIAHVRINVTARDIGALVRDIETRLQAIPRPAGFELTVAGSYEEQQEAFSEMLFAFVIAVLLVYMVLACQYESLRNPFIVIVSVPTATIGVVLALSLTGTTFNLQSGIGCIMLAGIVVNNAILLVDQTHKLQLSGQDLSDSLREAGRRRLRPILMTTLTTVLGLLPLALGFGEGADVQAPLGRAVIGGLLASTILTLFFVPTVYQLLQGRRSRI
jgi:HAE1 family hydrophobic/amphiphilic exporter-1